MPIFSTCPGLALGAQAVVKGNNANINAGQTIPATSDFLIFNLNLLEDFNYYSDSKHYISQYLLPANMRMATDDRPI